MRVLVLGGTQFIGRHVVDALVAQGDDVTLFNRGKTNPGLFAECEHLVGDRNGDLSSLAGREWDATIDPSAYVPRQVSSLAQALGGRGGRYVHISSSAVYARISAVGTTEDSPHVLLEDPTTETVTGDTYGGLKYLCEVATHEGFGPGGLGWSGALPSIVRPTYVAGPYDHTGRFTWWVLRIARGGEVLVPGPASNPFQVIDVRDTAQFVARLAHGEAQGTFHLAGPPPPFNFGEFLDSVAREVAPTRTELHWVDGAALARAGLSNVELPLWEGVGASSLNALDPSRALAAGLVMRPLSETIRDVYAHETANPSPLRGMIGLSASRERELLSALG